MPNIAQQDYYRIHIDDIENVKESEKALIIEKAKSGIIFDCLFIISGGVISKAISIGFADSAYTQPVNIALYDMGNGQLTEIILNE